MRSTSPDPLAPGTWRSNSRHGFTLIEAMVVAGILAIVVALAYPTYVDQVRKTRRADAEASLLAAAQIMERCFTRLNTYTVGDGACNSPAGPSQDGFYQITISGTATTYTLTATAQGDQANDPCGDFTLDYLGNKAAGSDTHRCWGSNPASS